MSYKLYVIVLQVKTFEFLKFFGIKSFILKNNKLYLLIVYKNYIVVLKKNKVDLHMIFEKFSS